MINRDTSAETGVGQVLFAFRNQTFFDYVCCLLQYLCSRGGAPVVFGIFLFVTLASSFSF